jgi:hypothetical protein
MRDRVRRLCAKFGELSFLFDKISSQSSYASNRDLEHESENSFTQDTWPEQHQWHQKYGTTWKDAARFTPLHSQKIVRGYKKLSRHT